MLSFPTRRLTTLVAFPALLSFPAPSAHAQQPDLYGGMRWRSIGPVRAGRARALDGVPSRPNVFYIGFDNGGVWRSTDYGSTWHPLFDREPTGSIGAIAVAPSDPNVIYVGSGAGIIRPDLAVGNGMYKSTDAGKTWTHIGLDSTQMIANVAVDPKNPDRAFVAALGHPYGPNEQRGVFRTTDGGKTWQKVLYKDEYTSANDVRIDPANPQVVYAGLWQQQEAYIEGASFGGTSGGIFKSTDGGDTWTQLRDGLPDVLEANLAIAPSDHDVVYAMVAGADSGGRAASVEGTIGLYRSDDAGAHWTLVNGPGVAGREPDTRPLERIGGGDLPTLAVDPTNPNVVYSASIVMWRSEDGGRSWSAVRGAPGGDDYQKIWINPTNPDILLVVSDQGAVVSANRGASWSNWYTQPTAAMYHVSTDNTFVYRVCGGQQDSGSACVKSRSDDGEITFHDWHPVDIQEYGIAAPDPKNPDLVYGGMRTNVSRYDRKTGQTAYVGPSAEQRGTKYGRNVRTMPIQWSPVNPNVLYYTSNVVWKSTDHAHSWTRISPDLARQTWAVPQTVGKYASQVKPAPAGSITAFSASPISSGVLWAGTDDGNIQVTTDGGTTWRNVTPPAIEPWTRIFNIEAGHFDRRTAYAAANTLRIDDLNPHFWRTHDGGRTWTEIDAGIAPGNVANSIREDPRVKGLLYAATDAQVWVSFDDGDHWESLRLNMPAISVRDIQLKDDSACKCADLIAGTHGRGFWILDDVTPLRQAARAKAASEAYLYAPIAAVRVRFGTNDPTPWPPELPAGENPPPGGIIDYYLAHDAAGPVLLEILDGSGKVVRRYASTDTVLDPHPAISPEKYDAECRAKPTAPYCNLPLYWPAAPMVIATSAGMHRVWWDLKYQPVVGKAGEIGEIDATGAVPGRTYPSNDAPWAPPGPYTVRLTVGGKAYTQPIRVELDPRVKTPAAAIARVSALSKAMYDGAVALQAAYEKARALSARLASSGAPDAAALQAAVDSIAPADTAGRRGFFRRAGAEQAQTLVSARDAMISAAGSLSRADVAPTAMQEAEVARDKATATRVLARWRELERRAGAGR